MPGVHGTDTQGYRKWLQAEELSQPDSLPDVKRHQHKARLSADLASAALDTAHGVLGVAEIAAAHAPGCGALEVIAAGGAVSAPFLVGLAGALQWAGAGIEGDELNAALHRDASLEAALNLGHDGLGAQYADFARAERDRIEAEYAQDSSAHALMVGTAARVVDDVCRGLGGLPAAKAEVSAAVGDGIRLAQNKAFGGPADVAAMERLNPSFRERYETDPAFHLGVDAVVWRAGHPAPAVPPQQSN